jgi:hypothetical protein
MEAITAERWLYQVLSGDTELTALVSNRVFGSIAPKDTPFPYVIYQVQAGSDVQGVGTARIMSDLVVVVKGVDRAQSFASLEAIADRIDVLLQGVHGSGGVLGSVRLQPLTMVEVIDEIQYRHLGGIYQVYAQ